MVVDSLGGEEEPFGNFRVAQTVRNELQDLDLPIGQLGDVLSGARTRPARNSAGPPLAEAPGHDRRRRPGFEPLELPQGLAQTLLNRAEGSM